MRCVFFTHMLELKRHILDNMLGISINLTKNFFVSVRDTNNIKSMSPQLKFNTNLMAKLLKSSDAKL